MRVRTARSHSVAGVAAVLVAVVALLTLLPAPAQAAAVSPTRLTHLADARQAVVVTSTSWSTSYATLRTWEKGSDGVWRQKFSPMVARLGYNGFRRAGERLQGDGTTPAGTFTITRAFGSLSDPGTDLRYRKYDSNDYWVGDQRDPRTYNILQPYRSPSAAWRTRQAERLADYASGAYRYAAVINFNMPRGVYWSDTAREWHATYPADTRRGNAIFLHVNGSGATAGCVSVSFTQMSSILRWLDPAMKPRIVMGPESVITQM